MLYLQKIFYSSFEHLMFKLEKQPSEVKVLYLTPLLSYTISSKSYKHTDKEIYDMYLKENLLTCLIIT